MNCLKLVAVVNFLRTFSAYGKFFLLTSSFSKNIFHDATNLAYERSKLIYEENPRIFFVMGGDFLLCLLVAAW